MTDFEPDWYVEHKKKVRKIQTDCLGLHAPETKKLCGRCVTTAVLEAAYGERERCALYLEACNEHDLASDLRNLR